MNHRSIRIPSRSSSSATVATAAGTVGLGPAERAMSIALPQPGTEGLTSCR